MDPLFSFVSPLTHPYKPFFKSNTHIECILYYLHRGNKPVLCSNYKKNLYDYINYMIPNIKKSLYMVSYSSDPKRT